MPRVRTLAPWLSILALTAACSSPDHASSTSSNGGAGGAGGSASSSSGAGGGGQGGGTPSAPVSGAPDTVDTMPAGAGAFTIGSEHYELYAEAAQADAVEMGRMLEAAYSAYEAYFKAIPPLSQGERLKVKFYADETSW